MQMTIPKNQAIIIEYGKTLTTNRHFNSYMDWNDYVVIDIDEFAEDIVNTIAKDFSNPDINSGELIDGAVDNHLNDLRQQLIEAVENKIIFR